MSLREEGGKIGLWCGASRVGGTGLLGAPQFESGRCSALCPSFLSPEKVSLRRAADLQGGRCFLPAAVFNCSPQRGLAPRNRCTDQTRVSRSKYFTFHVKSYPKTSVNNWDSVRNAHFRIGMGFDRGAILSALCPAPTFSWGIWLFCHQQ